MTQADDALGRVTETAKDWKTFGGTCPESEFIRRVNYERAVLQAKNIGCGDFAIRKATLKGGGEGLLS